MNLIRTYLWGTAVCTSWATVPLNLADWIDALANPIGMIERWLFCFLILLPILTFFIGGIFLLLGATLISILARRLRQSNHTIPFRIRVAMAGVPVGLALLALVVWIFELSWRPSSMSWDPTTWRPVLMAAGTGAAMGFGAAGGIESES